MNRLATILLAFLLLTGASGQSQLQSTVPGDLLGWETDELDVVISVMEESRVQLNVYSPAFDPDDYRASLEGRAELGDERYDGGEGELASHFQLYRNGTVMFERSYGVAPHATELLFDGVLAPGEYHLRSTFEGLGKNTFVYSLTSDPEVEIYFEAGATLLFNISSQELQPVMRVIVEDGDVPADFEIYDGDGIEELRGRLDTPSGPLELPISRDLEWSRVRLGQAGTYTFSFYLPEGAYQHTNTIGIRTNARLLSTPDGLRFTRAAPVRVRIIDTSGVPLAGTYDIETEGDIRTAILTGLPEGYELVDTRTEGGWVISPDKVRFGPAGGVAIYVAQRLPEPPTLLTVTASLEYPGFSGPWPLDFLLNGNPDTLADSGELTMEITPGLHVLRAHPVVGASVSGDVSLAIQPGEHAHAHFVVRPLVELDLTVDVFERYVGQQFVFTATGSTLFEDELPGLLELTLPEGLRAVSVPSTSGSLQAGAPLVLTVIATGEATGDYLGEALLSPWELRDSEPVRVIAVEPEPVEAPELEPEPEPVTEPEPEPTAEPEPEPQLPDFRVERMSTVYVDFQASQVAHCELPLLQPGESVSLSLPLRVTDADIWAPAVVLPATSHDDLHAYIQDTVRSGDGASSIVHVRNYGGEAVQGTVLVPLPLGAELAGSDCSSGNAAGEELLVSHEVPAGGSYLPGSSMLDDAALAEPRLVDGTLVWRLPYQRTGTISYGVSHAAALPALAEPQLTVLLAGREHQLAGELASSDFDAAAPVTPTLIQSPAPGSSFVASEGAVLLVDSAGPITVRVNGAPVAGDFTANESGLLQVPVALERGSNLISISSGLSSQSLVLHGAGEPVNLSFEPVRLVADGRNSLLVDVIATDADGVAVGNGMVSIGANSDFANEDPDAGISGFQVELVNGRGQIEFLPATRPFNLQLAAAWGELTAEETLRVLGTQSGLWQAMVSVTARVTGGFSVAGEARGYVEVPLGTGTLQAALDIADDETGFQLDRSLSVDPDPTDRFPLTGAANEARPTLQSSDGFAILYTDAGISAGYLHAPAVVPGISGLPSLTGLHAAVEVASGLTVEGYAALVSSGMRQIEIVPDGTRRYSLGESVRHGSETVTLITGAEERVLERNRDYVLDDVLGAITLARPLWPLDSRMNEVRLLVQYAPVSALRDVVHGGLGVRYESGDVTVALGAVRQDDYRAGFSVAYALDALSVRADLNLTFGADLIHSGSASISYAFADNGRLTLAHTTGTNSNRTSLSYRHDFLIASTGGSYGFSAGVGYAWEPSFVSLLLGTYFQQGALNASLEHDQGLAANVRSTTSASVSYRLNDNLSARVGAEYVWGNSLDATLGLVQRVGDAELELTYQLPTATGRGNLARFGVRAPFALTDNLSLDLHAGATRSFNDGTMELGGGAAVRYRHESFVATLGGEVAHSSANGFKVVFRAGASGQLGLDQNLSFDANYQIVPSLDGRLSLAYSLKRGPLNFLTYHRLLNRAAGDVLEGEVAPTLNFRNVVQLRPNFTYRLLLDDPVGNAYQGSLFAVGYFEPSADLDLLLGLGLGGHALWQPGTDSISYGVSAEVQARIIDEVWFGVGYTFGGYRGLTADTSGGLYLRLDLVGGGQF